MESLPIAIGGSIFSCRKPNPLFFNPIHSNPLSSLLRRPLSRYPNPLRFRSRFSVPHAHGDRCCHDHHQDQHHHHHHDHDHQHQQETNLSAPQEAVLRFARATRWSDLADFLREHLQLCCCSAALLLAAAACPYFVPKPAVRPIQNVFIVVAFPLVGVCV